MTEENSDSGMGKLKGTVLTRTTMCVGTEASRLDRYLSGVE